MEYLADISISGVWGEKANFNDDSYGGQHCAEKDGNSNAFRWQVALGLVRCHLDIIAAVSVVHRFAWL